MFPDRYDQPILSLLTGTLLLALLALATVVTVNQVRTGLAFEPSAEGNQITVDGTGTVDVTPDIATLYVTVETEDETSDAAKSVNADTMNDVVERMKMAGVEDKDLQTERVSVYEQESYNVETEEYEKNGWIASSSVTVTVRDTSQTELLLDLATDAGATHTTGPNFRIDDTSKYTHDARQKAIEEAKEKAEVIADSLGLTVGKIVDYYEYESGDSYYPMAYDAMEERAMGGSTLDLQEGSEEVSMNVSITFKLK